MFVSLVLLFLVPNVYFLADHPAVNVDEAWTSDAAFQFSQTGHFTPAMFRGMHYNLAGKYRWSTYQLTLAAMFKAFGFGLYQARFVSFLAGLLALLVLFLLGKRLYNWRVGLLAAILFAFSPIYEVNRIARPEAFLTACVLVVMYLCLLAMDRDSRALYILSGLVAVVACDIHLNGVMVLATGGLLLLIRPHGVRPKARAVWLYLAGVLVGGVIWLIAHGPLLTELTVEDSVFPPAEYWAFVWLKLKSYQTLFWGGAFQYLSVASVFMVASLVALGRRRRSADQFLLTTIAAFIPFYVLIFINTHLLYLSYLFPFLYLALAAFVDSLMWQVSQSEPKRTAFGNLTLIGAGIVTISLGFSVAREMVEIQRDLQQRKRGGYASYVAALRAHIPANAVVMGQPTWFYGFSNQPYYADRYFAWVSRSDRHEVRDRLGNSFDEALAQTQVEYLIIDSQLYQRMLSRPHVENALPEQEVLPFLKNRCVEVAVIPEVDYGEGDAKMTHIYKVRR